MLLYCAGLRLQECLELRVKDRFRAARDHRAAGEGPEGSACDAGCLMRISRPGSAGSCCLARCKCARGLGLFVAIRVSGWADLAGGAVRAADPLPPSRVGDTAGGDGGRAEGGVGQAGGLPHISPFVRDPPAGRRVGHPHRPRTARSRRCQHDDDLHARTESRRAGCEEPHGPVVVVFTRGAFAMKRATLEACGYVYMRRRTASRAPAGNPRPGIVVRAAC